MRVAPAPHAMEPFADFINRSQEKAAMPEVLFAEPTPNENAMKFTLKVKAIESGSATIKKGAETDNPIAKAVLAIDGVVAVFLLNDFVTVTKAPEASWMELQEPVKEAIGGA